MGFFETDESQPIIAYRAWMAFQEDKQLHSVSIKDDNWSPLKETAAVCQRHPMLPRPVKHDLIAPDYWCTCGFYAHKSIGTMYRTVAKLYELPIVKGSKRCVFGKVALWGRVIEHELGYRAQFAYPQVLYTVPWESPTNELIKQVAAQYAIDVNYMPTEMVDHVLYTRKENETNGEHRTSSKAEGNKTQSIVQAHTYEG